jgi:sensor histidine kinase YesM
VADDLMPPMLIQPLVENAVKHGIGRKVPGGTVRVTVDRCDGVLRVVVSDDGIGFDPIHAVTGVGLANVRARVAAVGGKVEIRSTPRLGTDVVLTLPSVES